jgi:hypothetical protein
MTHEEPCRQQGECQAHRSHKHKLTTAPQIPWATMILSFHLEADPLR